ncbi:hypothetical protein V8E36_001678, partial [Tilletia maclaganii]
MIEPPSEATYDTSAAALAAAQAWAREHGYALVKKATAKGGRYIYLACDRLGSYRSTRGLTASDLKRKNSTAKTNCPFRLRVSQDSGGVWSLSVTNAVHQGHDATSSALSHPIQRRISAIHTELILSLSRNGSKPRQIVNNL